MKLVSPEIEAYCRDFSCLPSKHCQDIEDYTLKNVPHSVMLSGPLVGSFMGFLIRSLGAKRVLEVGTYTGYSALVMAEQLPSDGEVVTLDINPETAAIAKQFWDKSPHGKKIRSLLGPASDTFAQLEGPFDFVFIDADKAGYVDYLKKALLLLSPKGVVVADNCLRSGEVLNPNTTDEMAKSIHEFNQFVNSNVSLQHMLLPLRDGLHLIRKTS